MDEADLLKMDIGSLESAYDKLEEVLGFLKDIDEFSNIKYQELEDIANDIDNLKIDKEIELERLEENA